MVSHADQQSRGVAAGRSEAAVQIWWIRAERAARGLEERPKLVLLVLLAAYVFCTLPQAYARLLWHDELFTYNLAMEPTVGAMLRGVRLVDLNPPLLYLLDFCTLRLPGAQISDAWTSVAARLPSLFGGLLASWGLFVLLRRRIGVVYELLGVSCFWGTTFLDYTWQDRPYALLVVLLVLRVAAWERATEPGREWGWVAAVTGLGMLLVGTHFMGIFILPAFIGAELARGWQRRKPDVPMLAGLMLPCIALTVYRSTFQAYGSILFPQIFQPRPGMIVPEYIVLAGNCGIALLGGLIFRALEKVAPQGSVSKKFPAKGPEVVLVLVLLLEPMVALAAIARSHGGFYPRYGLPACWSIAMITVALLWRFLRQSKAAALLVAAALCAVPVWNATTAMRVAVDRRHAAEAGSGGNYRSVDTALPLVAASGLTYVEMNHREPPPVLRRLYFLRDRAAEIQYAHATIFDGEDVAARTFNFQSKVETLEEFEAEHPRFLVLGTFDYSEDWLLRKLEADGDTIRPLGRYETTYKDHDLYEVTIREASERASGGSWESR
jgi:Dolichyl-phosphate-mannose-protein mannosyltransferase